MIYLILTILLTVFIMVIFKYFEQFSIDTFQAIVVNYFVCVIVGYSFLGDKEGFHTVLSSSIPIWGYWAGALGIFFIFSFYIIAKTAQISGVSVVSVASKLSMIIPICISLFILKSSNKSYDIFNYLGLLGALIAVGLSSYKKRENNIEFNIWLLILPLLVFLLSGISDTVLNYVNFKLLKDGEEAFFTISLFVVATIFGSLCIIIGVLSGKIHLRKKNILGGIALGIPNYFSIYFLIKALSSFNNDGALLFPLNNIGIIIISTLMALLLFKEKLSRINTIGLVLASVSIVLLSYQELFF